MSHKQALMHTCQYMCVWVHVYVSDQVSGKPDVACPACLSEVGPSHWWLVGLPAASVADGVSDLKWDPNTTRWHRQHKKHGKEDGQRAKTFITDCLSPFMLTSYLDRKIERCVDFSAHLTVLVCLSLFHIYIYIYIYIYRYWCFQSCKWYLTISVWKCFQMDNCLNSHGSRDSCASKLSPLHHFTHQLL